MGGKPDVPAPPDFSGIALASEKAANIAAQTSREQLAWAKQQYGQDKSVADRVVNSAITRLEGQDKVAASDRARYVNKFQPLEDQLIADQNKAFDPRQVAAKVGAAQADVSQQFAQARQAAQNQLEGFGVDPSQVRFGALDLGTRVQEAAARAGAGNQARDTQEAVGRALRSEAINIGRGYPGQIAQQYGTALQSGNQAVNAQVATSANGANMMGTGMQWGGLQNQSLGVWGNALTNSYNAQMQAYNAKNSQSSGLGSALGLIGGVGMGIMGLAEGGMAPDGAPPNDTMAVPPDPREQGVAIPTNVSPSRGRAIDDVPAMLTPGEFVVPKDVVAWEGEKSLQKFIQKARDNRAENRVAAPKPASSQPRTAAIPRDMLQGPQHSQPATPIPNIHRQGHAIPIPTSGDPNGMDPGQWTRPINPDQSAAYGDAMDFQYYPVQGV